MSINKKDRCLFGNKEEQLRIYNQRRTINRLEKENKQLKENWNKIEQIIENERMSHWAPSPLFLTELLTKMQELEKNNSNE